MEDPVVFDPPSSNYTCDDLFRGDAEPLAIPPLDPAMLNSDLLSDFDLEFNLDDLEFSDDLLFDTVPGFNSETPDHHSSLSRLPCLNSDQNSSPENKGFSPGFADQCLNVDNYSDHGINWCSDAHRVSDAEHGNNDRDSLGHVSSYDSRNGGCDFSKASNYQSSGSDCEQKLNYPSPESGSCDQFCSNGSGGCNSGVCPMDNPTSPDSCQGAPNFLSSSHESTLKGENFSTNKLAESNIEIQEVGNKCNPKRKKEQQEEATAETRTGKFRKSTAVENTNASANLNAGSEEDERRKARLMRNRESAQLSRQRKKQYVEELEDKVRSMHFTITELNSKISYFMAENASLRQQLSGGGLCPLAPPGTYPMAPMGYPWMPCPPYVVRHQGSQVPLVPIPRLRPQQPASAPKVNKKSEKKREEKTKKVASISFLGLLFFVLLFGVLMPIVNVRYGGKLGVVDRLSDTHTGRTLVVDGEDKGRYQEKHSGRSSLEKEQTPQLNAGANGSVTLGNYSEPLVASLYVPRNDKLVKIDGNLIIHSVLASERAMASQATGQMKTSEETRLAIARNYIPTYHVAGAPGRNAHLDRDHTGRQKALGSGSADILKSSAPDGRLQQWFREDLAGPLLSSGMCTEVFQFDVSPSPGSIVPATSMTNTTSGYRQNSTNLNRSRNRRILRGRSIPLKGCAMNLTEEHFRLNTGKGELQRNTSSSSIVVSVLIDPREAVDSVGEGMMSSKSLSRIFVVVLIDSVKYVTYSCMLPLMGSSPHLVAA